MARRTQRPNWRLTVLILALALGTGGVVLRLIQVQILDHAYYVQQAEDEHQHQATVRAPRAAILDRNGFPLATTVGVFDVYVDPRTWRDDGAALEGAAELAPLLSREPAELIASVRSQAQGEYLAARSVDAQVGLQLAESTPPGVRTVSTSRRFYPEGDLASALLGFIGRDEMGLAGVEADFDTELGGVPGTVYFERDALGNEIPFGRRLGVDPRPGGDVTLTIDRYLQRLVEKELDAAIKAHGATGGNIIVMQPHTGEVMAMASRPTFQLSKLNLEDGSQVDLFRNRAVTDVYSPGSVMKTITMATAVDLGLVSPRTTYNDDGIAEIEGGETIKNWDFSAHGITTMVELLQYSLNTGAVWLSDQIGARRFYEYMARFGFGEASGIGLGGDPAGIVRTNEEDDWYPVDLATNSFGQGISVSPVQMVTAVSALVNGGLLMRPYVVKEVAGPEGRRVYEPVVVQRAVSEETSRTLVEMMHAVVDGMPSHLARVPGYSVGGKTGTTTFPDRADTIASFVGFAPVEDPRFVMLITIDSPKDSSLGGVVAAPIFSDLAPSMLTYLGVRPDAALVASGQ
jgi:cell division protein FtsI/penicillin-binding protein 2